MPFVHLPFVFRSFDLFVASLLFMKSISYCVIRRKLEPLDRGKANFNFKQVCMISAVICVFLRWVWHLYNLPCVSVLFWLVSIARFVFKSPGIFFWGTKYEIYCECVAYSHSVVWRRARLWLELFASTVDWFLSQLSYLSSYVFFRRSFTSRKL